MVDGRPALPGSGTQVVQTRVRTFVEALERPFKNRPGSKSPDPLPRGGKDDNIFTVLVADEAPPAYVLAAYECSWITRKQFFGYHDDDDDDGLRVDEPGKPASDEQRLARLARARGCKLAWGALSEPKLPRVGSPIESRDVESSCSPKSVMLVNQRAGCMETPAKPLLPASVITPAMADNAEPVMVDDTACAQAAARARAPTESCASAQAPLADTGSKLDSPETALDGNALPDQWPHHFDEWPPPRYAMCLTPLPEAVDDEVFSGDDDTDDDTSVASSFNNGPSDVIMSCSALDWSGPVDPLAELDWSGIDQQARRLLLLLATGLSACALLWFYHAIPPADEADTMPLSHARPFGLPVTPAQVRCAVSACRDPERCQITLEAARKCACGAAGSGARGAFGSLSKLLFSGSNVVRVQQRLTGSWAGWG